MFNITVHSSNAAYLSLVLACSSAALAADPIPFANYARFVPTGPGTLNVLFEVGPFTDQLAGFAPEGGPLPGWDANVEATIVAAGDPPSIDESTFIATLPLFDTLTVIARDPEGNEIGHYSTLATGAQKLDLNAANANVDDVERTIQLQFGGSLLSEQPAFPNMLVEATGIYESAVQIADDGFAHAGGTLTLPLDDDPNTSLQENILSAYAAGQFTGVDVVAVYGGTYVPEPSSTLLLMLGVALLPRMVRRSRRSNASYSTVAARHTMSISQTIAITSLLACLAVGTLARDSLGQSEIHVVSPSELEQVEGNRGVAGGRGGGKYQGLYYAEDFISLPDTYRMITGFAWRPDGNNSFTDPVTGPARFALSTTDADGLSSTFADNLGDDATVVFDGTLIWQDKSVGSVPRDFDFYVPFDVPFPYDPTEGNLVLEFVAPMDWDHAGNWYVDERELFTGNVTAVAGGASSSVASVAHRTIFVAQFTFVPEPSSAALVCLGAITLLVCAPHRTTRRVRVIGKFSTQSASFDTGG